jgi:hypothetical protein
MRAVSTTPRRPQPDCRQNIQVRAIVVQTGAPVDVLYLRAVEFDSRHPHFSLMLLPKPSLSGPGKNSQIRGQPHSVFVDALAECSAGGAKSPQNRIRVT